VVLKSLYLRLVRQLLPVLTAATLVACNSGDSPLTPLQQEQLQFSNDGALQSELTLAVPQRLRTVRDINPANLRARAFINGVETGLQQNAAGQFTGQIPVPARSSVSMTLEFYEMFSGVELTLASVARVISTDSADTTISFSRDEYDYDSFDADGDSVSNILEREFESSPFDAAVFPDLVSVDVFANPPSAAVSAGFSDYDIEITVADQTSTIAANLGVFQRSFQVLRQVDAVVEVMLIERLSGQQLVLGTQSRSLNILQDLNTVVFESADYDLDFDQDADGNTNLAELISGTDLITSPPVNTANYFVTFDVPPEIANPASAFAVLLANGNNVDLLRTGDTYSGSASVVAGTPVSLDVVINDTFQGQALTLASFAAGVQPVDGQVFNLENFSLIHDEDNDGVFNYVELAQGTDPFTSAIQQQCTPVEEEIQLASVEDAYTFNGRILNELKIRVDKRRRVGLIRYQYDTSQGDVAAAGLTMTVGADEGDGLISVYAVPALQWADSDGELSAGVQAAVDSRTVLVSELNEAFFSGEEYTFQLAPAAITSDFTLVFEQEPSANDVAFESSETAAPPVLRLRVSRCE